MFGLQALETIQQTGDQRRRRYKRE